MVYSFQNLCSCLSSTRSYSSFRKFRKTIFARHISRPIALNWCNCAPMNIWYYIQWSPQYNLEQDSKTTMAWNHLRDIFSDNKNFHALYLEQEFLTVRMENFSNASFYCQHLKSLVNQLSNVEALVTNDRLVL